VRYLQTKGLSAQKTSRTGYAGTDISVDLLGIERRIEVKVRARAFNQLYRWLANSDLLIIRADRREPLVVLPMWLASEIATVAEDHNGSSADYTPPPPQKGSVGGSTKCKTTPKNLDKRCTRAR
jgi:hypothetical protein